MILKRHDSGDTRSEALYSDCGAYRYRLSRDWGGGPRIAFIMLNPSTASELRNDPTVARCEGRARRGGFGGFDVLNLFAFRATRPEDLRAAADPFGAANADTVLEVASRAATVVCGWGVHGAHLGQGAAMRGALAAKSIPLWHLGLTREFHPRNPLCVANRVEPLPWL
ncbi:MAG: DUF1643 domain-containing protein [Proteobacteria bacterium]|nr:DUF1643 domain-containing protein [Pseudomonadota bacterium]